MIGYHVEGGERTEVRGRSASQPAVRVISRSGRRDGPIRQIAILKRDSSEPVLSIRLLHRNEVVEQVLLRPYELAAVERAIAAMRDGAVEEVSPSSTASPTEPERGECEPNPETIAARELKPHEVARSRLLGWPPSLYLAAKKTLEAVRHEDEEA